MEKKTKNILIASTVATFIVGGGITYLVVRKKIRLKKGIKNYSKTTLPAEGINLTDIARQLGIDLGTAFPSYDPRSWTENDDDAVKTVLKVPKTKMPEFKKVYATLYKRDAQADLQKLLDSESWSEVKYLFA